MHPTQQDILDSLRKSKSRKFNELLQEVAETSDNLTYHLKQLQKSGYITSPTKGTYVLAENGLIYLNNNLELNHNLFPTLSCMLDLSGPDNTVLLMRKRKRPYLGSVHLPTFGIISSRSLHEQIENFLHQYAITASNITFRGLHRERARGSDNLFVFDKFFVLFPSSVFLSPLQFFIVEE